MALATPPVKLVRVVSYVDGFNLYFGLKESRFERYLWLNLFRLSLELLKPGQQLYRVKYFTSRISRPEDKRKRQTNYLEALGALANFEIFEGQFLDKPKECFGCHRTWLDHEEKMTDVNIATQLLLDAFDDKCDTALVVSADSDLVPPILAIRQRFPAKRIVAVFPPSRFSIHLRNACHAAFPIGRANLAASVFPDEVTKPDGYVLKRPPTWGPTDAEVANS